MSSDVGIPTPPGWAVDTAGPREVTFSNSQRGLQLSVVAVFASSRTQQQAAAPTHWTVHLQQDWFGTEELGEKHMAAKVKTREEALSVAQEFMHDFEQEHEVQSSAQPESMRGAFSNPKLSEHILTRRVCASVFTDAVGYSDELLRDVLREETNEQYRYVVHRDGHNTDLIGENAPSSFEETRLASIYASFSVDQLGVEQTTSEETPITMTLHLNSDTIHRYIFGDGQETDIVIPRGLQVVSPCFEQTLANVLQAKWE